MVADGPRQEESLTAVLSRCIDTDGAGAASIDIGDGTRPHRVIHSVAIACNSR